MAAGIFDQLSSSHPFWSSANSPVSFHSIGIFVAPANPCTSFAAKADEQVLPSWPVSHIALHQF
jgi:hypothetical protein